MGWRVDSDIQQMLRDSAEAWLAEAGGPGRVRTVRALDEGFDPAVWGSMGELGWTGIILPEAMGGSALGLSPALTLAEEFGRSVAPEPFVASAIMAGTVLGASSSSVALELAAGLATGQRCPALAWQEVRGSLGAPTCKTRLTAGSLNGAKVHVPGWHAGTELLVTAQGPDGLVVVLLDSTAHDVQITSRRLADSSLCADIVFEDVAIADDAVLLGGAEADAAMALAIARGTVAISAQLEGLAGQLWQMTSDYLQQRSQFGSKLSEFQAIRHRMVDLYTEIELAAASWRAAATAVEAGDLSSVAIHAAKARCSQAAQDMGRWGIQYHGAFGYMEEADVGLYVHAGLCWSNWLGNPAAHRRAALLSHRGGR